LIDRVKEHTIHFFNLPKEKKLSVKRSSDNSRGYFNDEFTKRKLDWKEGYDFGDRDNEIDGKSRWLEDEPEMKTVLSEYFNKMLILSSKILQAFAVGLGLQASYFDQFFGDNHTSFLRLNYYPICPDPERHLGISPHRDAGILTLLLHDEEVSGLQIFREKDEQWITVPSVPSTITVNIGDMAQVWSNNKYKAILHRVLANKDNTRISMPFFYNPSLNTVITPLNSNSDETRYSPISWRDYRKQRFMGDYSDVGEEIQIDHFKKL